jgi:hypothetical protein
LNHTHHRARPAWLPAVALLLITAATADLVWTPPLRGFDALQFANLPVRWVMWAVLLAPTLLVYAVVRKLTRSSAAGALGVLIAGASPWLTSLIDTPVPALLWAAAALLVTLGLTPLLRSRRIPAQMAVIGVVCLCMSGLLNSAVWLHSLRPLRTVAMQAMQSASPGSRMLVLNVPSILRAPHVGEVQRVLPEASPTGVTLVQVLDGRFGPPGRINGFDAFYGDNQVRFYSANLKQTAQDYDAIVVNNETKQGFVARVLGAASAPVDMPVAVMRLNGAEVRIEDASACRIGPGPNTVRVRVQVRPVAGEVTTAKIFRQAFAGEQKVSGDDGEVELAGGYLQLADLRPRGIVDFAYLEAPGATHVLVGVYDWQSGERWTGVDAAGVQLDGNALRLPVEARCAS